MKGIHLEGLRVLGKPEDFAQLYYEQGADELIFQDTVASLYQRNNIIEIVIRTAKNIFIPFFTFIEEENGLLFSINILSYLLLDK